MSGGKGDKTNIIYNGKVIKTCRDLSDVITKCKTKKEARNFLNAYRKESAYADENIGYIIGYQNEKERKRLYGLFNISHPVLDISD